MADTIRFRADQAVNMAWQPPGPYQRVNIVAEAGEIIEIPAEHADRFEALYGKARPNDASVSNRGGLIPGLRRVG